MKKALLIHHDIFEPNAISKILFNLNYSITILNSKALNSLIPSSCKKFNLIIIFGGNSSANDKSLSINNELIFISHIVKYNVPIMGICLGAQLIAKIYGSKITQIKHNKSEIGYKKLIKLNNSFFKKTHSFMQFHSQGISLNESMEVLSTGRLFDVDAFKIINKSIYCFQFHPEVDEAAIYRWYKSNNDPTSKYKDSLIKTLKNHNLFKKNNYNWLKKIILKISS